MYDGRTSASSGLNFRRKKCRYPSFLHVVLHPAGSNPSPDTHRISSAVTPTEPSLTRTTPSSLREEHRLDPEVHSGRRGRLRSDGALPGQLERLVGGCGGGEGGSRQVMGLPGRSLARRRVRSGGWGKGGSGLGLGADTSWLDAEAVKALWL